MANFRELRSPPRDLFLNEKVVFGYIAQAFRHVSDNIMTSTNNPSKDITESLDYQAFIESMVHLCHCDRDRPCDGVLAGGLCDGVIHDLWDEDDDRCEDDDHD